MANSFNPVAGQQPAQATAAVLPLAAPTNGQSWIIPWISWDYSAAPTGGKLTISWVVGSTTYTETYTILLGGWNIMQWFVPRRFPANVAVTITLASGAGTVVGQVFAGAFTST